MLINPGIVFTFTRQWWSSTTFSSYLALLGVKIEYIRITQFTSSTYTSYSLNNLYFTKNMLFFKA